MGFCSFQNSLILLCCLKQALRFFISLTNNIFLVGLSSEQLIIDLDPVEKLLRERNVEKLKAIGIPALQDTKDVQEYIVHSLLYLLRQRDKISAGLLDSKFPVNLKGPITLEPPL